VIGRQNPFRLPLFAIWIFRDVGRSNERFRYPKPKTPNASWRSEPISDWSTRIREISGCEGGQSKDFSLLSRRPRNLRNRLFRVSSVPTPIRLGVKRPRSDGASSLVTNRKAHPVKGARHDASWLTARRALCASPDRGHIDLHRDRLRAVFWFFGYSTRSNSSRLLTLFLEGKP
jgi:hypothetical protein